ELAEQLAALDVPEADDVVVAAGRERLVVDEHKGGNRAAAVEMAFGLGRVRVPDADGPVAAGRREPFVVRRERERVDLVGMTFELGDQLAGIEFPEHEGAVLAAGGQERAADGRRYGERLDRGSMAFDLRDLLAGGGGPEANGLEGTARD